jgi:hypothetical protein
MACGVPLSSAWRGSRGSQISSRGSACGEFNRFLGIACASALETKSLLLKGLAVGYWTRDEFERLDELADRGLLVGGKAPEVSAVASGQAECQPERPERPFTFPAPPVDR